MKSERAHMPLVLAILDGWGYREGAEHNAIAAARTPAWDRLWHEGAHTLLEASEAHVGLPDGQMGNSEVGHMNIGAGRIMMQDLPRIDHAIESGELARHPLLGEFVARLDKSGGICHLMGLFSDGGVHAHIRHMEALADIVALKNVPVAVHAFLDGRDTPPKSALTYIGQWEKHFPAGCGVTLATLSGRYWAMDRDNRRERTERAWQAIAEGTGGRATSAGEAIEAAYAAGITDEFIPPTVLQGYPGIKQGDGILMANFRADRARQLLHALLDPVSYPLPSLQEERITSLGMVEY